MNTGLKNTVLKKTGFGPDDRVVILHADDIGMCESTLSALTVLLDSKLTISSSTMVPCAWFPSVAALCRRSSEIDMGVHFTLTAEWDTYRWSPIKDGLRDEHGYFPKLTAQLWEFATPSLIERELDAQFSRAIDAGIDVSHVDDHMAVLQHPTYINLLTELALKYDLPARLPGPPHLTDPWHQEIGNRLDMAHAQGLPLFDQIIGLPLDRPEGKIDYLRHVLATLKPGTLSVILGHPASDTPELRAITPDWRSRVTDLEAMASSEFQRMVQTFGIQLITFRALRTAMRSVRETM
jgi:predicted glycoside hydrolase/deacetylase ChbG (UPF0249 family)